MGGSHPVSRQCSFSPFVVERKDVTLLVLCVAMEMAKWDWRVDSSIEEVLLPVIVP